MQKDSGIKFQDLDEVLHDAQLRRSADLGLWLRHFIQERRLARQQKEADRPRHAVTPRPGSNLLAHWML